MRGWNEQCVFVVWTCCTSVYRVAPADCWPATCHPVTKTTTRQETQGSGWTETVSLSLSLLDRVINRHRSRTVHLHSSAPDTLAPLQTRGPRRSFNQDSVIEFYLFFFFLYFSLDRFKFLSFFFPFKFHLQNILIRLFPF